MLSETSIRPVSLPASMEERNILEQSIKEKIISGNLNPLEFYRVAKLLDEMIDRLKKDSDIFGAAADEVKLWGKEKPVINGSVIDTGSRTTYDYDSCNDSVYNRLKEQIKEREKYLKALPPQGAADPETGEVVLPPTKKVSEFITVKI